MPYVDTTPASFEIKLTEETFQKKFADLLTKYGWKTAERTTSVVKEFTKVVMNNWDVSTTSPQAKTPIYVAKHTIFGNAKGKMFGMAFVAKKADVDTATLPAKGSAEMETLANQIFKDNRNGTTVYYYMLEKLPEHLTNKTYVEVKWGNEGVLVSELDPLQMALDIEVSETDGKKVTKADPNAMQSPIAKSVLRASFMENIDYPIMNTNWWPDSEIRLQGYIDENSIFAIIQTDNVPAWENNVVPSVPLYFGTIDPIDAGDDAVALFTGTVPTGTDVDSVAEFDFDGVEPVNKKILPILKTYPAHPSNGVDSVMVSRSKFGARYQEYFLSLNTGSNQMPPDRKNGEKEYPRAWNNSDNEEYKYQFNPSRYSGKVHTSKVYLVHPEEGVRGSLSKTVGLSALNFNAGKLRIRKQNCPEVIYDVYRFHVVGAVSPLTKRPATAFRPVGIGIYDSEFNPNA